MVRGQRFRCLLMGEGVLPLRCAQELERRGHDVALIVTATAELEMWARERNIVVASDLGGQTPARPYDLLLSINNPHIVPQAWIDRARVCALNYHDSPLPRYAGLHATVWGLLARERDWAVTWHVMDEAVDAGDIVVVAPVPVPDGATAWALNVRCYEVACESFVQLLDDLERGHLQRRPQARSERTYFRASRRPSAAGMIDFSQPADVVATLVRALDFGPTFNPLGLPKLWTNGDVWVCRSAHVTTSPSTAPPGTVVTVDADSVTVATGTFDVRLQQLLALHSGAQQPSCVGAFAPGQRVAAPAELRELWSRQNEQIAAREERWRCRLARSSPLRWPAHDSSCGSRQALVRSETQTFCAPRRDDERAAVLLAALMIALGRYARVPQVEVALQAPWLATYDDRMFSPWVPCSLALEPDASLSDHAAHLCEQLAQLQRDQTFARDLLLRDTALSRPEVLVRYAHEPPCRERFGWTIVVAEDAQGFWLEARDIDARTVHASAQRLRDAVELQFESLSRRACEVGLARELRPPSTWCTGGERPLRLPDIDTVLRRHGFAHPDATAVVADGRDISYGELEHRVDALADRLCRHGVGAGDIVALRLPRKQRREQLRYHARELGRRRGPAKARYLADKLRDKLWEEAWPTLFRMLGERRLARRWLRRVELANLVASLTYAPAPYEGDVVLLRAKEHPAWRPFGPFMGWGPVLRGSVEEYEVPGDHVGLYGPAFVEHLAQHLRPGGSRSAAPVISDSRTAAG